MSEKTVSINEVPRIDKWLLLSIQHLFAMFGATILVPLLTELPPSVALVSSGLGTLAYLVITKGKIPAYLGSSFAFIMPIIAAISIGGPEGAMIGSFFAGLVYGVVALIIKATGVKWLMTLLPPIVVGPVIMVIGLGLAATAIDMAMNDPATESYSGIHFSVAMLTLLLTIIGSIFFRGFFGLVPILFGIVGGYIAASVAGIVDFQAVREAAWFEAPEFIVPFATYSPAISWEIVFIMVPIALVTLSEHIGDQMVLSKVAERNFVEDPGLHRSIMGDGAATVISSFIGGPPNTTYGENIGVVALTRVFSTFVIGGAAVLAVAFGFIGKVSALINTIPQPVMGGVSILLFGIIASNGMRMLIDNQIDIGKKRNLIISSVILVVGIGGAFIQVTDTIEIAGMALATVIGILLNLILPGKDPVRSTSEMFEDMSNNDEKKESA
ncbi:solute carrier family 23 protein [Salisediminibacterium halotolerans]|uniref:solute carrier family 23 protein n=1 Tax=Salisediminibacterium halotolerans TaxID=517425 RepID=UPI000EB0EE5A|nr:solute carrier family 23 protein [Salisediminibacterium halotolerans]RLJ74290.1 uracil permease [Actinophytocola xinjiangensis]RPE87617.1 uracil permease [Salisediminibacterium halotolerans]TWG35127.1 uracil permease [Salisediminibacterium halotolerans]GEL07314.1 uracil permease [Salisediminibacterium halotolerans]